MLAKRHAQHQIYWFLWVPALICGFWIDNSVFWSCFACTKLQVISGTHRDLLFWSKSRCFASKNHRWGLEPIETSISDARHAVLLAQNHRWGQGPIETCNSGPTVVLLNAQNHRSGQGSIETSNSGANHAVFHAQNDSLCPGPIETCYSGLIVSVFHPKTTDEDWNPYRLEILMLGTPFWKHKIAGEGWDP